MQAPAQSYLPFFILFQSAAVQKLIWSAKCLNEFSNYWFFFKYWLWFVFLSFCFSCFATIWSGPPRTLIPVFVAVAVCEHDDVFLRIVYSKFQLVFVATKIDFLSDSQANDMRDFDALAEQYLCFEPFSACIISKFGATIQSENIYCCSCVRTICILLFASRIFTRLIDGGAKK